ncbi:MAG: hypothetical protein JO116_17505 [Planctomycetaceae bacterium]|nr:hypothetical protein [Planctomycetaceae bacterium]
MPEATPIPFRRIVHRLGPWLIVMLTALPAVWHVVDFEDDADVEFPRVARPTFSRRPPPAYRLAEPGDTIDRVALYLSAWAIVLALTGLGLGLVRARSGLWPAALAIALAGFWYAATPGPTFDGWHGLGWRAILDAKAPLSLRVALVGAALGLSAIVAASVVVAWPRRREVVERGRARRISSLLVAALVLVASRQVEVPGVEPVGYWPRWMMVAGLIAFDLALVRAMPRPAAAGWLRRAGLWLAATSGWAGLVAAGLWLTWYHRPLERFKAVVPGKIYISAMPTARGLEIAHRRHHFKTIINLFPEDTPDRSPRLPDEQRFAREHGIRFLCNTSGEAHADAFLDQTLALARDPDAWPILIHCHACQDRTPAWVGIYRFVVEGRPLAQVMQEIERHRGYRPKASVTLLYNRVLEPRAPWRYASDPTAALLRRCAAGTHDPFDDVKPAPAGDGANPAPPARVSRPPETSDRGPSLTLGRRSLEYHQTLADPSLHESAPPP